MKTEADSKKVSIVLAAFNALEYSKVCLKSILEYTPLPYELVLIDNGSSDGTKEYFETLPGARIIRNEKNLGFARGYNQGIKASRGKYIVLINNDCIVSENWLSNMLSCADSDPAIGMVGPRGNHINGVQRMDQEFSDLQEFHDYTMFFNKPDPAKWFEVNKLVGFCILVKREVVKKIGYFDESFGIGTHEDIDYTMRAKNAGFKLFCAGDVFLYHFSHRTFIANNIDLIRIYKYNKALFQKKWSIYKAKQS
ncbi:MAG: glycosyltransferase family 2 protein [Bacillota bacterium]|nr:glycosyltransferase family 2 protein [Bacillota bacterium]